MLYDSACLVIFEELAHSLLLFTSSLSLTYQFSVDFSSVICCARDYLVVLSPVDYV